MPLPFILRFKKTGNESTAKAPSQAEPRPTDDQLWDQTLRERDAAEEWADKLADAIAKHLGIDIGEHTSNNSPWLFALDAIREAAPSHHPLPAGQAQCSKHKPGACCTYDKLLGEIFKDKAVVEQKLFDAANGKTPMPDAQQLRELALLLGHSGPLLSEYVAASAPSQAGSCQASGELTDANVDRLLSTTIPGGSHARDWFLPHEHEAGLKNVRGVVRAMLREANALHGLVS